MLRDQAGDKAVVLRFRKDQLPAFTLWKNTAGLRDGYVTGLEPATNYPNQLPFKRPAVASSPCLRAAGTLLISTSRCSPPPMRSP